MKWFKVAREGQTTDGRTIQRDWISDMAETYDRANYAARIWLEHIRGLTVGSPFDALGDVLSLRAGAAPDGKLELFAELAPTETLRAINARGQKLFTSIEVDPDFARTGRAYLVGLGVTDSPASLGTEMLSFCAGAGAASPLAGRKIGPGVLFSAALPLDPDPDPDQPAPDPDPDPDLKTRLSAAEARLADVPDRAALETLTARLSAAEARLADVPDPSALAAIAARLSDAEALLTRIADTPDTPRRPTATGGPDGTLAQY